MKKVQSAISLPLAMCLLFLSSAASCHKPLHQKWAESQPATSSVEYIKPVDANWKNSLFFLEGQLCAWVRGILEDQAGNLWFTTNHYGVMRWDGDSLVYFDEKDGLGGGRVSGIVEDQRGHIWIGTAEGLCEFDGDTMKLYADQEGLVDNEIWTLALDQDGLIWIGTMEGVSTLDPETKRFKIFALPEVAVRDTSSILSYYRITSILEDRQGRIWIGRDGFGLLCYDPSKQGEAAFTNFTEADGLPDDNVADLLEDQAGHIWIGSMYGGMSRYEPAKASRGEMPFTNFTQSGVIKGEEAYGLYEDKKGHIWFAAEHQGIYRYEPEQDSFTRFSKAEGLPSEGILAMLEDQQGRFWLGGWGGLFRYRAERLDTTAFVSVTKAGPWE